MTGSFEDTKAAAWRSSSQVMASGATYDRDPSARATFGIYAPETRKNVHVREQF
jgi:MSHA biogenesis protein MshQ